MTPHDGCSFLSPLIPRIVLTESVPRMICSWNNTGATRPGDPGCIDVDPSHTEQAWCYCKNKSSETTSVSAYKHEHGLDTGPGLCTSIVSQALDGSIHHARNLDWNIPQVTVTQSLPFVGIVSALISMIRAPISSVSAPTGNVRQAVKGMLVDVDFVRSGRSGRPESPSGSFCTVRPVSYCHLFHAPLVRTCFAQWQQARFA